MISFQCESGQDFILMPLRARFSVYSRCGVESELRCTDFAGSFWQNLALGEKVMAELPNLPNEISIPDAEGTKFSLLFYR